MIRSYEKEDIIGCVQMLIAAYNGEPWGNHWTEETGSRYLSEFTASRDFVGWVALEDGKPVGVLLSHRQTWWTRDELYVDELFVHPDFQGKGYGKRLLQTAEDHCIKNGLAGVTLLTNRHMPALAFYQQNGYTAGDHVIFLYKVISSK